MPPVSSNVCNVGKLMRSYSGDYRVSPGAVKEMLGNLDLWFEVHMKDLCRVAKSHGRHTIMEDDVIEFFSVKKNNVMIVGED